MILCPNCKKARTFVHGWVFASRIDSTESIRRYRYCPRCGYSFKTVETYDKPPKEQHA